MYLNKHGAPAQAIVFFGVDYFNGGQFVIKIYEDDSVVYEELGQ